MESCYDIDTDAEWFLFWYLGRWFTILGYHLDSAQSDYNLEKEFLNSINNNSDYHLIKLERLKKKIIELHAKWDEISLTPIPDHLWVEKED